MNTIIIIVIIYMRIMVDEYSFAPVVMRHTQGAINVNLLALAVSDGRNTIVP